MKSKLLVTAISALSLAACTTTSPPSAADFTAALADPTRPKADAARDTAQKASELLAFAGIGKGQTVADILPGGGYWTRLFAKAVGPEGQVFGVLAQPPADVAAPATPPPAKTIAADPNFRNVSAIETPLAEMRLPRPVDVMWSSRGFRDFYRDGRDGAKAISRSIYRNLKPGGVLVVIDHSATSAMSINQQLKLGRIDPGIVKTDIESAGFRFVGESKALANPTDDHSKIVNDPLIAGHTDQFVYKFRKPR